MSVNVFKSVGLFAVALLLVVGCASPPVPQLTSAADLGTTGGGDVGQLDATGEDNAAPADGTDSADGAGADGTDQSDTAAPIDGTDQTDAADAVVGTDQADGSDQPDETVAVDVAETTVADGESVDADALAADGAETQDGSTDAAAPADVDAIADVPPDVPADVPAQDIPGTDAISDIQPDGASDTGADSAADTGGPVTPGSLSPCDNDSDCSNASDGKKCKVAVHACVQCLTSKDCAAGDLCQDNQCKASKACKSDTDCKTTNQVCDKVEGACVDCSTDADCSVNTKCFDHACIPAKPCKSSKDCDAVCDQAKGVCVQCVAAVDCGEGQACLLGMCKTKLCSGALCAGGKSFACQDGSGYAAGKSCDDANVCTDGDGCDAGSCVPGPAKKCDDGNPCTADSCDPKLGCVATFLVISCDDGNPCTEVDTCGGGVCAGKTKFCDDGQLCTADQCQNGLCVHVAVPGVCTDGSACTDKDLCDQGKCKAGTQISCDDQNQCTTDSCNPASGCVNSLKTGACDDGNNCTQNDACNAGKCAGVGKQCDDGNPCTDDKCDAGVCAFVPHTKACDDGDACTDKDSCIQGKCAGFKKDCNDNNPCTTDSCLSTGCAYQATTAPCDDGNGCTENDLCSNGFCAGAAKKCDDSNSCTSEKCDGGKCVFTNVDGGFCGSGCNLCKGGVCQGDPNPGLDKTYGSIANDSFRVVLPAPNGGWLLAGKSAAKSQSGYEDAWVVRVDGSGVVLWEKFYGGSYSDFISRGVVTPEGTYALVGTYYNSAKVNQVWLLVIDDYGSIKVDQQYGQSSQEYGNDLVLNAAGYALVGTQVTSSSSSTVYNGYVVQADKAGAVLWDKVFTTVTQFNSVVAIGDQLVIGGPAYNQNYGVDALIMRIKAGGSVVWNTYVGGNYNDSVNDIKVLADGSLAVAGKLGPSNAEAFLLANLSAAGAVKWKVGYAVSVSGEAFAVAENGNQLVMAGRAYKSGASDAVLIGVDKASGTQQWTQTASSSGTSGNDALFGLLARPGGGLAAVGQFAVSNAGSDGWLLLLSATGKLACNCESSCSDGNPCTLDTCSLGKCSSVQAASGTACTDSSQKPGKCDSAGVCKSTCGNKICESGESTANCPGDCPLTHPCNNYCGGKNPSYGCYCDAQCKSSGDCCTLTGGKAYSCSGSTCATCK